VSEYKNTDSKSTLALALAYVAKHPTRYLFPTAAGQKGQPCIKDNLALASNDPRQLEAWHKLWRGCGWGLSLKKSGLVAVDIDVGPGKVGGESYKALKAAGFAFPTTETQASPSGGRHAIYSGEHHFSAGKIGKDIDSPNYIMIAGNVRADGKAYTLYTDAPVAPLPEWIAEKIKPRADRPRRESTGEPVPFDWLKRALAATPYTGGPAGLDDRHSYQGWLEFAMAAHEAASGDEGEYMWAFIEWSLADPSPDWKNPTSAEYVERKWQSFTADPPANAAAITRASWLKVLNSIGQGELTSELEPTAADDFAGDPITQDEIDELSRLAITRDRVTYRDFLFSLPDDDFIFIPSGASKLWSGKSVNLVCDGPALKSPILEAAFQSDDAAKAFAKADEGWNEAQAVYEGTNPKPEKPKRKAKKPDPEPKSYWEQRFSGLDIDDMPETKSESEAEQTEPPPPKSRAQRLIERVATAFETSPMNLRSWMLRNGISEPDMNWIEPARMSATAAVAGDEKRRVAEMTWWPGKPSVIYDTLVLDGGIVPVRGTNTFNRYRKALLKPGKFPEPTMWLEHIKLIYPEDWLHILQWFAWRVQHPEEKILHALVLGGATRIGKDTLVHPLPHAIGPWNFKTTNAQYIMDEPKYNDYLEAVVCLINEAKDFGENDRFAFYERMKPWLGGTARGVLMVADKYIRVHPVIDVWGAIVTTNFKVRGLFLPEDDARHYVAWSNRTWEDWGFKDQEELSQKYFKPLYDWYESGGNDAVAHYLMNLSLDVSFPKSPPPKTAAWYEIVAAYSNPEKNKLAEILEGMGDPPAVTLNEVGRLDKEGELEWLVNPRNIPAQFEDVGYVRQPNPSAGNGKWLVGTKRRAVTIYVRAKLSPAERTTATKEVHERVRKAVIAWELDPSKSPDPLG
jgi:hypothetical protein